jgi:hypothetical protein
MMENTKENQFVKDVLNESIPEWINPDFNMILMDKIRKESRKRKILNTVRLYLLMFVSIDAVLLVLANLMHISITSVSTQLQAFQWIDGGLPANAGQFILVYFVVLLAASLVIGTVSSTNDSLPQNGLLKGESKDSLDQGNKL